MRCSCGIGERSAEQGEILDLHPATAKQLLRMKLAEPYVRHPAHPREVETATLAGPPEIR
jgi:hypothetical protein